MSCGLGAGAEEDACGVGEELVASGAAKAKVDDRLGATGGEELVVSGNKIWVKLGATGGKKLLASGAANAENGFKLGETDREGLVGSGASKIKIVGRLVATGGEELEASGAANVKTGNKLVTSDAAKVKTGVKLGATGGAEIIGEKNVVIEVSFVLDGGLIARASTWLVSGIMILDGGGDWETGAKGVVLARQEDS